MLDMLVWGNIPEPDAAALATGGLIAALLTLLKIAMMSFR